MNYIVGFYKNGQQYAKPLSEHLDLDSAIFELKRMFDYDVNNIVSFEGTEWTEGQTHYSEDTNNYAIFASEEDEPLLITPYHFGGNSSNRI